MAALPATIPPPDARWWVGAGAGAGAGASAGAGAGVPGDAGGAGGAQELVEEVLNCSKGP